MPLRAGLALKSESSQIGAGLEQAHPVVEGLVGLGLADEEEMQIVQECAPTQRLMGVEVVAEQGDGTGAAVTGGVLIQPALGGGDLAVLLVVAVLRDDKCNASIRSREIGGA